VALSSIIADFSLVLIGVLAKTGASAFGIKLETWQAAIAAFVFLVVGWGIYFLVQRKKSKKPEVETGESCPTQRSFIAPQLRASAKKSFLKFDD
jgi:hypothetical protein